MRRSIRLAIPAAAAAAMLALSACGGDDDEDGGDTGGSLGAGEQEEGANAEEESGGEGSDSGGDGGGEAPTAEQLEGAWATGLGDDESVLTFSSSTVTFAESTDMSTGGAACFGTLSGDSISLECDSGTDWSEATLALNGEELNVSWASGTTQTYQSLSSMPGMEDMPNLEDMPGMEDLEGDLAELEDMQQELEDLGY
ncbi:hypothetical protein SAMN06297387_11931 [Streptomyces zhaozhouensis]|uniref:Uncharacterized protein n=1 Tax=Streptomyces zhaozhouensis TaxID=1300267 RepID=A0A286E1D4_9ACTN|nr:hypothetical protein [Streptomyces zhaozhouensis]SOD64705.1 hypothetical protein SAMN06297387_11931 [Streptomyces zhaozhouensis]